MRATNLIAAVIVLAMVGAGFGAAITNVSAFESARDSAGYFYTDSKAPTPSVALDWIEIRNTGANTYASGDDDTSSVLPIGFDFEFYGRRYSALNVSTNALVMFGTSSSSYSNDMIPDTSDVDSFVAVYWDDLYANSGEVVFQTVGSAPFRQFVVEWYNVTRLSGSNLMTFEVVLNETSNDIWCQYLTLNGETGTSASEGMENQAGTIGLQYGYGSAVLTDGLAIRYSPGIVTIGPSDTKTGRPSDTLTYNLVVFNRQSFADSFAITYVSDLGWSVAVYDALMNPLGDTDGDLIPDTGTVPSNDFAALIVQVDLPGSPASSTETTTLTATSYADPLVFDTCILVSVVLPAWLSPPHSDYGDDTDSDGDYNYLIVDVSFHVLTEGWYYISGILHTSSEWAISSDGGWGYYGQGDHTAQLMYYGWIIRGTWTDGPYHVHLLIEDNWGVDIDTGIHTTAAYSHTDFMEVPGSFVDPFTDMGVDTDSDGLFDHLAIDVVIDVNYDGRFVIYGYLYDTDWNSIGYELIDVDLVTGTRTVTMVFDAWEIVTNGVSGPFYAQFTLFAEVEGSMMYMDSYAYFTPTYDLADFERPGAMFQTPHSEFAVDTDSDGLYDYLVIEANVSVTVEGDYTVSGYMENSWGNSIGTITNTTHLTVGNHTVELAFLCWSIYYYGDDGPFDVYFTLFGHAAVLDEDYYETLYYGLWEFENTLGWFEAPHVDSAIDNDADTLYDYLKVEIGVNVTVAGTYLITADLENSWGWSIEALSNTTYLTAGWNSVEIWFTGWIINDYGYDPYQVELYLYDSAGRYMHNDWIFTAAYLYTDFEGIPAYLGSPHSSWAVDDDSDGDYDRFIVNVTVEVTSAGLFLVTCEMYDSGWGYIGMAGTWATLDAGTNVVAVEYPGWRMYANGWSGTNYVYIYLYDENRMYLDDNFYTSESYDWDSFDATPATIMSPYAGSSPTVDGAIGATEWADAVAVDLDEAYVSNEISGTMYVMNDNSNLYVLLDMYGDMTENEWDYSSISFDTGNDDVATDEGEDEFTLTGSYSNSQTHYVYSDASSSWTWHCAPFEEDGLLGTVGFGPSASHMAAHRIFEYAIPLELLETSAGDELGFILDSHNDQGVYDDDDGAISSWPMYYSGWPEFEQYGQIILSELIVIPPPTTTAAVSGTAGANGWYKSDVSVALSATGGDGGVDYTQYRLDGGSWTTYSAAVAIAGDGTHTLEYRSADNTGQVEATKTLTVKIDKVLPVTAADVTEANVWLNCTDATSGMASIMYRIDGGTWIACTGMITVTGAGTHTLEFYATDAAGNTEAIQTVTVSVDVEIPEFSLALVSLIGLLVAVAAILIVLLLMKRRKGQQPTDMGPAAGAPMEPPPPQA